ncbi:atlastin-3-like isoform X2 [Homalodisca vitripennis]|uniref:atlastin-3-like isoform X2 n=1 Tax=Homalodisca vitripennis TaxID=197043 RepID=UPI001EEB8F28|nr:atlastin-3-like isoform X2 [Homalodisca vitripennis]
MTQNVNKNAIQILSTDGKAINIIEHYENGPTLSEVFCNEEHRDMPMLVFSVTGKTRGGKSFLLNLAAKYLEHQGDKKTSWMTGKIPSVFDWNGGIDSITKGLWICPKIYETRNHMGEKVGILLMDNQGLFDGEIDEGVSVAISGISTAISSYVMYNIKEKICSDHLEGIWRFLIKDSDGEDVDQSKTCLMFVIRDYIKENYGLVNGQQYIENEQERGTQENRTIWENLLQIFPNIKCLPLPHPGIAATKKQFKGDLNDLEEDFMSEIDKFFNDIFNPKNLNAPIEQNLNVMTGFKIYSILKKYNGVVPDNNFSFLNIFTEYGNQEKLNTLQDSFQTTLKFYYSYSRGTGNPNILHRSLNTFLQEANPRFRGNSATEYRTVLERFVVRKTNIAIQEWILDEYENKIRGDRITVRHDQIWPDLKSEMRFFVGSQEDERASSDIVVKKAAEIYYKKLSQEILETFRSTCKEKSIEEVAEYFTECQCIDCDFRLNRNFNVQENVAIWMAEKHVLKDEFLMILVEVFREKKSQQKNCSIL